MGNLTAAHLALVQAAIDEANASMGRALAVIENAYAVLERNGRCNGCQGEDFGDCAGCSDPDGRVYGGGGENA